MRPPRPQRDGLYRLELAGDGVRPYRSLKDGLDSLTSARGSVRSYRLLKDGLSSLASAGDGGRCKAVQASQSGFSEALVRSCRPPLMSCVIDELVRP